MFSRPRVKILSGSLAGFVMVFRAFRGECSTFYKRICSRCYRDGSGSNFVRNYAGCSAGESSDSYRKKGDNLILMGSPGAGKTTVGRMVARLLGKDAIDIDDDHLEQVWGMTVAEKLFQVGSDGFIDAEGSALLQFSASDAVVSLSGSNPMHQEAMEYTKTLGTVVYLDVNDDNILSRLAAMKVDRIVGQNEGTSMEAILNYRKQFYERSYDIRVTCEKDDSAEVIATRVLQSLKEKQDCAGFTSTRQEYSDTSGKNLGFLDVVLEGLAPDRGLYVPRKPIPHFTQRQWERLVHCTYQERALRILEAWMSFRDIPSSLLHAMISKAYSSNFQHEAVAPVIKLDNQCFVQELFHGPTASFKDFALQMTPQFFDEAILQKSSLDKKESLKILILVATSGDTGSAVLEGFTDLSNIRVMVLYPEDGVSQIQKAQMKSAVGTNVCVIGVESDFDFCQTAIKGIFNDRQFANKLATDFNVQLSAANSINWGRLLPQVVYHASAYLDLVKNGVISMGEVADLCIPTGNFGNILAAFYARNMGIPFNSLICASNENNILTDFFHSGSYDMRNRRLHQTISPSIDILKSSNLERLLYHVTGNSGGDVAAYMRSLEKNMVFKVSDEVKTNLSSVFKAEWSTRERCLAEIRATFEKTGYLLDTHTAIAKDVANRFTNPNRPMIISGTAHYSKFAHDILTGLGNSYTSHDPLELFTNLQKLNANPCLHKNLENVVKQPVLHKAVCKANVELIKEAVKNFIKQ